MDVQSSSPLTLTPISRENSTVNPSQARSQYRESRQLPFELSQHVQVYLEESMFMQAIRLLSSIVSADASGPDTRPITIPPPVHISLLATLTVHPNLTTRTAAQDKHEQANSASRLLRLLNKTVGSINAKFNASFMFTKYDHDRGTSHRAQSVNHHHSDSEEQPISTPLASSDSIWSRADDFWAVVGWAMNCACHPPQTMHFARWTYWNPWLSFTLDVLEDDWCYHDTHDSCEETLLWQYIELAPGGNSRIRRILRAIFADSSFNSLNEFREIFRGELKPPKEQNSGVKKREANVDVDKEIYGDYLDNRDHSDSLSDVDQTMADITAAQNDSIYRSHSRQRRSRTRTPIRKASNQSLRSDYDNTDSTASSSSRSPTLGPPEAMTLRLRLLNLLVQVAAHPTLTSTNPAAFPNLEDLTVTFVEFINPLPLPAFTSILFSPLLHYCSPTSPTNQPTTTPTNQPTTTFPTTYTHELLLRILLESSAPRSILSTLSPPSFSSQPQPQSPNLNLTPQDLSRNYLRYSSTKHTPDANARTSLTLESLLRFTLSCTSITVSADEKRELVEAVRTGIERRMERVREGGRRRKNHAGGGGDGVEESEEAGVLIDSGKRMMALVSDP